MRNLTVFGHHTSFCCYPNQRTDCIKHIHKQESKYHNYHFLSKDMLPLKLEENRLDRRRSTYNTINMRQPHWNTDNRCQQNTKEQRTTYPFNQQDRSYQQTDDTQQRRTGSNIAQRNKSSIIVHNNTSILQTQESNKQTDTRSNRIFQRSRQGIHNLFTQVCNSQQDKDNSFKQYSRQRKLPRVTQSQTNRISKKGIQPHTWSQSKRQFGIKSHEQSRKSRSYYRRRKQRSFIHPRRTQDIRIHCKDIGHRQESSDTCQYFGTHASHFPVEAKQFL